MTYDFTTTLELAWKQCGEETKLSFTNKDGIYLPEALSKVFTFLESAYGYSVLDHARKYLEDQA